MVSGSGYESADHQIKLTLALTEPASGTTPLLKGDRDLVNAPVGAGPSATRSLDRVDGQRCCCYPQALNSSDSGRERGFCAALWTGCGASIGRPKT